MMKRNLNPVLLMIVLLLGMLTQQFCRHTESIVSRDELIKYINNPKNGLVKEQEVNGIAVRVSFQPGDMLVRQELEAGADTATIDSLKRKYNHQYYFNLKFSKNGKEAIRQLGGFNRYSDMVQVLSFRMAQFVNLTTPMRDTVELSDYIFDQTYGMSNGNTVLLSFDKSQIRGKEIYINLAECGFGTGALQFMFNKNDIDRMPMLLLK